MSIESFAPAGIITVIIDPLSLLIKSDLAAYSGSAEIVHWSGGYHPNWFCQARSLPDMVMFECFPDSFPFRELFNILSSDFVRLIYLLFIT